MGRSIISLHYLLLIIIVRQTSVLKGPPHPGQEYHLYSYSNMATTHTHTHTHTLFSQSGEMGNSEYSVGTWMELTEVSRSDRAMVGGGREEEEVCDGTQHRQV